MGAVEFVRRHPLNCCSGLILVASCASGGSPIPLFAAGTLVAANMTLSGQAALREAARVIRGVNTVAMGVLALISSNRNPSDEHPLVMDGVCKLILIETAFIAASPLISAAISRSSKRN